MEIRDNGMCRISPLRFNALHSTWANPLLRSPTAWLAMPSALTAITLVCLCVYVIVATRRLNDKETDIVCLRQLWVCMARHADLHEGDYPESLETPDLLQLLTSRCRERLKIWNATYNRPKSTSSVDEPLVRVHRQEYTLSLYRNGEIGVDVLP